MNEDQIREVVGSHLRTSVRPDQQSIAEANVRIRDVLMAELGMTAEKIDQVLNRTVIAANFAIDGAGAIDAAVAALTMPMVTVSDDFSGGDGPLGEPWELLAGTGQVAVVRGGQLQIGGTRGEAWGIDTRGPDHFFEGSLVGRPYFGKDGGRSFCVRMSANGKDYVGLGRYTKDLVILYQSVDGVERVLTNRITVPSSAVHRIEAKGNQVTAYADGQILFGGPIDIDPKLANHTRVGFVSGTMAHVLDNISAGVGGQQEDPAPVVPAEPKTTEPVQHKTLIDGKIGVVARVTDTSSLYGQHAKVVEMLNWLGVKTLRCGHYRDDAGSRWNLRAVASQGFRFIFTYRDNRPPEEVVRHLEIFDRDFPGQIVALEGPNEPDLHPPIWINPETGQQMQDARLIHRTSYPPATMGLMKELVQRVRGSSTLHSLPVLAYNDWNQGDQAAIGVDYANSHPYPRGGTLLSQAQPIAMNVPLPTVLTETGTVDAPTYLAGKLVYPTASPESQAAFTEDAYRTIMADPKIAGACFYQLMEGYRPASVEANKSIEFHFGLFDSDFRPKPAAEVLRGLLASR